MAKSVVTKNDRRGYNPTPYSNTRKIEEMSNGESPNLKHLHIIGAWRFQDTSCRGQGSRRVSPARPTRCRISKVSPHSISEKFDTI